MLRKLNKYKIMDNNVYVYFNNIQDYFICDLDDFYKIKDFTWWAKYSKWGYYAVATIGDKKVRLHRMIVNCPDGMQVDHINGNTLDNRKCNLRVVTNQQNSINSCKPSNNTSGYKGVYLDKQRRKWVANIKVDYKTIYLGRFDNINDAIKAREEAEIKYFGEYRRVA